MINTRFGYFLLLGVLLLSFCKTAQKNNSRAALPPPAISKDMPTPAAAPPGDYAAEWAEIDSLERQGLYKSALERSELLYARAKKDQNTAQTIKTLLFRGKYTTQLDEDGFIKAVQMFEAEAQNAGEPEQSILHSLLGELYATYLSNQGWRIQERSPIPDGEGGDILTWSAAQLEQKAIDEYVRSVARPDVLRGFPVESYRAILTPGKDDVVAGEALRPSLFDLLAHRALGYFANERSYLTEPAYKFYLDQPAAFDPAAEFVKTTFATRDSSSGKWLGLRLFQQLLSGQASEAARVSNDLLRLQFVRNNAVLEDKHNLYERALEYLHKAHYNHPVDAEIVYALAQALVEQDNRSTPPPADGSLLRRAVSECEDAIRRHPGSFGAGQCQALLADIRRPNLSLETELVSLPQKPVLTAVSYKNIDKIWVKVVSVPNDPELLNAVDWDQRLAYLNARPSLQQRSWNISNPGDFRQHRTEIKLDPLPAGRYYVLVAANEKFSDENAYVSFASFTCSQLASVEFRERGQLRFAVVHRETGQPLAGVQADFFEYQWDRNARENVRRLNVQAQSDQDGLLNPQLPVNTGFSLRLSKGPDSLWASERFSNFSAEQPVRQREAQFFTDRALYRPGQTVYFKGIVLQRDEKDYPRIVPNTNVLVKFFDTNEQEKAQLKLRSNEFGTFNGAFTAPASGLTGQMRIEAEGLMGSAYFNVEEYKRPRFEVTFKPVEGAYRVNETVTLRGEAKNYAGSAVDGAQLRYRVVRQARFPWWDWWSKRFPGPTERMEIANGEAKTGADGSFEIKFTALPDRSISKKDQPLFDYQVIADVTDITGETRSSETSLSAGYIALNVEFELGAEEPLDSLSKVAISTTNTAGQFQAAAGTISVMRLDAPAQTFVERYWEKTDIQTIPEADFHRDFPNYAWNDEDNPEKWSGAEPARVISFNTATAKQIDLGAGRMTPGYYRVLLQTKDAFGEPIEIRRFVRVWDSKKQATRFVMPTIALEKNNLVPGETARVWLGGKAESLSFLLVDTRGGKTQTPRWHLVNNGAQAVDFPVSESDRGGFFVDAFSVKNNRYYSVIIPVTVPWSNKDLTIRFESFRDKLLPGQKEEWRLRISGPKKDKVAAEMVAALYDASLDQFMPHAWAGIRFPQSYESVNFNSYGFAFLSGETRFRPTEGIPQPGERQFDQLNWFNFPLYGGRPGMVMRFLAANDRADGMMMEEKMEMSTAPAAPAAEIDSAIAGKAAGVSVNPPSEYAQTGGAPPPPPAPPAPRRNLNETVFFFPELRTDAEGNVILKFTMNEALTRWKLLTFSHTKELEWALAEKSVLTQKDLMIITNPPRFLREGDVLEFTAKVSNLSQTPISGTATLKLFDAGSMAPAEEAFGLGREQQAVAFSVPPGQSAPVSWRLRVPEGGLNGLTWQVFAEGKTFADGEENTLPVLSNRMLVTETLPITVRGNQSKTVVFDHLKNNNSASLRSERYTLEFTSNPAWYAVQALPYLMEFPHECTEQMFSRFYANALASSVTQKLPSLRRVYDKWKGTGALKSNLSKNQELKTALLEETPWVLDAQSEEQQKQNIALLFDLNRMSDEQERALATLSERQAPNGGWPWFPGGREDWYITQYIVTGFGHLDKLGALSTQNDPRTAEMWNSALSFCDERVREHYRELEKAVNKGQTKWDDDHLDGLVIQYLYARSFAGLDANDQTVGYYLGQAEKYWLGKGLYQEGLLALALHRSGRTASAAKIVASLRERAQVTEELGMYWPFDWGMYWYQLPIETQALMVEVFDEAGKDPAAVEELRVWLLKNKQTNRWESTKATAEAVYALLLHGDNWLNNTKPVQISLGGKTLKPAEYEPGTGYFKESWAGKDVKSNWSTVKVDNPNSNLVWGAAYWQYFEDLDKIESFRKTPLTIVKQLYREENSPTGPQLRPIGEGSVLHPGDKIKVRIEIRVDRQMEYVHLKDMRASGLEPLNVLSGYRWQDGLGYYESTKDLATHFFIDYLPRGTFVFEYPLVVNHRGNFSNGITTLQCMYAPEFSSHSQGIRVKVE